MAQQTYLFCISTPWETVKAMPLYRQLLEAGNEVRILQTGFGIPDIRLLHQWFDMPADTAIDNPPKQASGTVDAMQLRLAEEVLLQTAPAVVVVEGGSAIAVAAALASYSRGIPVAHLDAGLRSRSDSPPACDKNQELIARLAHWHFTATEQARCNLLEEDIAPARIFEVGSTLIDAAIWTREHLPALLPGRAYAVSDDLREFLFQCRSRRLILAATENPLLSTERTAAIAAALASSLQRHEDSLAVWAAPAALHEPAEAALKALLPSGHERLRLAAPVSYPGLINLLTRCSFLLTDSHEMEQQASAFGKPALLLRDVALGHPDLIKAGGARFAGNTAAEMTAAIENLLLDPMAPRAMQLQTSPFGDGNAAIRIVDILSS